MSKVEEIESAVTQLSSQDLAHFRDWFSEFDSTLWDQQIAEDATSGRLDALAEQAVQDLEAGRCTEL